ncbi:hypothetical protein HN630_00145 [archaeon]|jgi:hypothetical protein|nr:hypothetical protein [archaeon]
MDTVYHSGTGSKMLVEEIFRLEDEFNVKFGVTEVLVEDQWPLSNERAYFDNGIIVIGQTDRRTKKELFLHELGHALLWWNQVPKKMLRSFHWRFHDDSLWDGICYSARTFTGKYSNRKRSFISGYSEIDAEESFCEVWSAGRLDLRNRYLFFDGEKIDLNHEPLLKRKLKKVRDIIKYCRR